MNWLIQNWKPFYVNQDKFNFFFFCFKILFLSSPNVFALCIFIFIIITVIIIAINRKSEVSELPFVNTLEVFPAVIIASST